MSAVREPADDAREGIVVRRLDGASARGHGDELARLLVSTVDAGASVSFLSPLTEREAQNWVAGTVADVERGHRVLMAAFLDGRIVGSAQLVPSWQPNACHRAKVEKVMVHPSARRLGVGTRLLRQVEAEALGRGLFLLLLDTESGSHAELLYARLGWTKAGTIPDYAMRPDGSSLRPTSLWYRNLT